MITGVNWVNKIHINSLNFAILRSLMMIDSFNGS